MPIFSAGRGDRQDGGLELRLAGLRRRHPLEVAELRDEELVGAAAVPVVVVCAAEPADELDDGVLLADRDLAMAAGAAVELAGDAADQVDLVALFVDPGEAPADARLSLELVHPRLDIQAKPAAIATLAALASCSPSFAPG